MKVKKYMTYLELLKVISNMEPEQQNQTVTVCIDNDEFFPIGSVKCTNNNADILDENHIYLAKAEGWLRKWGKQCSNPQGHFQDNQGYCHSCGILLVPELAGY